MKKVVVVLILLCSSILHSVEQEKKSFQVHVSVGTSDSGGQEAEQDSGGMVTGKIVGTTIISAVTGAVMTAGMPLVKNSDALTPFSFGVIAGILLYSQAHIIKKMFGSAYTDFATWLSTSTMVGLGMGIVMMDKASKKERHIILALKEAKKAA
jgi:hypothetical protein